MQNKLKFLIGTVVFSIAASIGYVLFFMPQSDTKQEAVSTVEDSDTTPDSLLETNTTPTVPTVEKETLKPLPLEQPYFLPKGAVYVDDYAFTKDGDVFFRPLTSPDALPVPNADAESFEKVSEFMTYPGSEVVNDCGAAPEYAFYKDTKQAYFYHYWRAEKFRSSHIDIMLGVKTKDFEIIDPLTISTGPEAFKIAYEKTGTTCRLNLVSTSDDEAGTP